MIVYLLCVRKNTLYLNSYQSPSNLLVKCLLMYVLNLHAYLTLHHACHSYSDAYCRYVVKNQVRGTTSSNGGPEDQLSTKHDLECPSVVFGWRSCPRDQGVAWGKAAQPGKLTVA